MNNMIKQLSMVDYVPPSMPRPNNRVKLIILEDNEAVIKTIKKGRSMALRHVPRTHRVNLDWLIAALRDDPALMMKYVSTKEQAADILTNLLNSAMGILVGTYDGR